MLFVQFLILLDHFIKKILFKERNINIHTYNYYKKKDFLQQTQTIFKKK